MRPARSSQKWWLAGILGLAALLRFWNLWRFGLHHDAALNSMRAFGWFDFLVGKGQTGPLIWLGHIPWWGNLSFHDHPPLAFCTNGADQRAIKACTRQGRTARANT